MLGCGPSAWAAVTAYARRSPQALGCDSRCRAFAGLSLQRPESQAAADYMATCLHSWGDALPLSIVLREVVFVEKVEQPLVLGDQFDLVGRRVAEQAPDEAHKPVEIALRAREVNCLVGARRVSAGTGKLRVTLAVCVAGCVCGWLCMLAFASVICGCACVCGCVRVGGCVRAPCGGSREG